MKRGFARNTDLESVRPAELHSAESQAPDMDVRWPHRQLACVPITRSEENLSRAILRQARRE